MPVIGAALGDNVHNGAAVASILGLVIREHTQFADGVDGENGGRIAEHSCFVDRWIVTVPVIHVGAIEQVIVRASAGAVHGKFAERARRIGDLVGRARHAGVQVNQLGVVAAIDRNILDLLGGQGSAQFGGSGLELGQELARDLDRLARLAGLQLDIHAPLAGDADGYIIG